MTPEEYRESLSAGFGQAATAVRVLGVIVAAATAAAILIWAAWWRGSVGADGVNRSLSWVPREPLSTVAGGIGRWILSGLSVGLAVLGNTAAERPRWRGLRPDELGEVTRDWFQQAARWLRGRRPGRRRRWPGRRDGRRRP